jgi:transcriptional regulator with XRE-family HTH domain
MKNLPRFRRAGGLTQYDLGRKAKVGRSKISDVEIGRAEFTDAERSRILAVLAVHVGKTVEALNTSLESDGTCNKANNQEGA